jgi:hypothetical protein
MNIKSDERVFVAGMTGSGKSFLSQTLLMKTRSLIVVDSKNSMNNWNLQEITVENVEKFQRGEPMRLRVVDNDDAYTLMEIAYKRGNCTVYFDETTAVIPNPRKYPKIITDIWTRGRSINVRGWAVTQRPVDIPKILLTEANHVFLFRLNSIDDRRRMASQMGEQVLELPDTKYGFWYYNTENNRTVYKTRLSVG